VFSCISFHCNHTNIHHCSLHDPLQLPRMSKTKRMVKLLAHHLRAYINLSITKSQHWKKRCRGVEMNHTPAMLVSLQHWDDTEEVGIRDSWLKQSKYCGLHNVLMSDYRFSQKSELRSLNFPSNSPWYSCLFRGTHRSVLLITTRI
jgi:hypothetical protein